MVYNKVAIKKFIIYGPLWFFVEFENINMEFFLMESIIRNRKKVYSVGNILTQTEINLSCMLENYEKCMHCVEVVHTYDNQD